MENHTASNALMAWGYFQTLASRLLVLWQTWPNATRVVCVGASVAPLCEGSPSIQNAWVWHSSALFKLWTTQMMTEKTLGKTQTWVGRGMATFPTLALLCHYCLSQQLIVHRPEAECFKGPILMLLIIVSFCASSNVRSLRTDGFLCLFPVKVSFAFIISFQCSSPQ